MARPAADTGRGASLLALDAIETGPHAPDALAGVYEALPVSVLRKSWTALLADSVSEQPDAPRLGPFCLALNVVATRLYRGKAAA